MYVFFRNCRFGRSGSYSSCGRIGNARSAHTWDGSGRKATRAGAACKKVHSNVTTREGTDPVNQAIPKKLLLLHDPVGKVVWATLRT